MTYESSRKMGKAKRAHLQRKPLVDVGSWARRRARLCPPYTLTSGLRHRDIEGVQGDRHQTIQSHEVGQLRGPMLAELLDGRTIGEFGQNAAANKCRGHVVGDRFLSCQIYRPLSRDDRRQLLVRQASMLGDDDVRI